MDAATTVLEHKRSNATAHLHATVIGLNTQR